MYMIKEVNTPDIKFIIIMATYNRKNGKTPNYLNKSLDSILSQSYINWDLIIIGDKYKDEHELLEIIDNYKLNLLNKGLANNIIYINNQIVERDVITNKDALWKCAGANSMNKGLEYARENNYKYYCHLDDDDEWTTEHLHELYDVYTKYPNCIFTNTKSTYISTYLPNIQMDIYENNMLPTPGGMTHSSISFRIDIIPYNYLTIFNTEISYDSSDSYMLFSIKEFLLANKQYCSIYIPVLTCNHDIQSESML